MAEEQKNTLRDALESAYDKLDAGTAPTSSTTSTPGPKVQATSVSDIPPAPEGGASTSSAPSRPRDDEGRFTKASEKPADKKPSTPAAADSPTSAAPPAATKAQGEGAGPDPAPAPASTPEAFKAPQSWKPAAREAWAKLPPEVQAEVTRREREIQTKLTETDRERREAGEFRSVVAPFEAMIRAQGATPAQAIDRLLRTGYTLQHGTPQQKAQIAAQIIQGYGVDIQTLGAMLAGQAPQTSDAVDPNTIIAQAEQRMMQRLEAQAAKARAQRNQTRIESFAQKHEFFGDVRSQMADILDGRGIKDPTDQQLEEVYDLACRIHPDVSPMIRQREAAKAAETSIEASRRAQAAASSVKTAPASAPGNPKPKGLRETLEQKYDELASGGRL